MDKPPSSPSGYLDPRPLRRNHLVIYGMYAVLFVALTALLFPGFISHLRPPVSAVEAHIMGFWPLPAYVLGFWVVAVAVHEVLHWLAARWLGYDPECGFEFVDPYVIIYDEFIPRGEDLVFLCTPLISLTALGLLLWLLPGIPDLVDYFGRILVLANTAGSTQDIYYSIRLWRKPRGSLFFNYKTADGFNTVYYPPTSDS